MIRHLFKLIWNRKQGNFLMIAEIFFSFLVLFGVSSLVIYFYNNYQKPVGFVYDNVWSMSVYAHDVPDEEKRQRLDQMVKQIEAFPEVEHVALGSENGPYSNNTWTTGLARNKIEAATNMIIVQSIDFDKVMGLEVIDGRWFNEQDYASNREPIVITQDLKEKMFGDEPAVNQVVTTGSRRDGSNKEKTVVGVVTGYKPAGEFSEEASSYFDLTSLADTADDAQGMLFIKVKSDTPPAFEEQILEKASSIGTGWTLNLRSLKDMRTSYMKQSVIPFAALFIVCLFLILNVALGLYGVLWQSINKRYSEIGLRRAIGASAGDVYKQFLGEIVVLATFGLLLGCFFAVQFPLLGVFNLPSEIYVMAILTSVVIIYSLVILCALYPSKQAASIKPAIALHEE